MHRLSQKEIDELKVGDTVYFKSDYDEISGQMYLATVTEICEHHILLNCNPIDYDGFPMWSDDKHTHRECIPRIAVSRGYTGIHVFGFGEEI